MLAGMLVANNTLQEINLSVNAIGSYTTNSAMLLYLIYNLSVLELSFNL